MNKKLSIEGMSCKHCVMHVTNALKEVNGVGSVDVNLQKKEAIVEVNENVTNEQLIEAVSDAGYDVTKID